MKICQVLWAQNCLYTRSVGKHYPNFSLICVLCENRMLAVRKKTSKLVFDRFHLLFYASM